MVTEVVVFKFFCCYGEREERGKNGRFQFAVQKFSTAKQIYVCLFLFLKKTRVFCVLWALCIILWSSARYLMPKPHVGTTDCIDFPSLLDVLVSVLSLVL